MRACVDRLERGQTNATFEERSNMPQPQEDSVQTSHRANAHHRHNNNNDGEVVLMERPKGGWDDAPGSPHRVPLVSNNNGSPRLTNRIANIYGLGKQQASASPHCSPRHRAVARLTNPAQEIVRKVINLPPKTELLEAASPKLSPKVSREDAKEIEEILCIPKIGLNSPKRNFYLNNNGNPSPGYHNPYQQASLIKSPLIPAGDTKFRFDHLSPKPAVDNYSNAKVPTSPRRFFTSRESLTYHEANTSEGSNCANDNDRSESRSSDCRQKSRLPLKVPYLRDMKKVRPISPLLVDVEAESRANSVTVRHSTETRSEVVTDCNTNILINDVPSGNLLAGSRENSDQIEDEGNTNNDRGTTDGQQQPNECEFSNEWNSTELSVTNGNSAASWNSDRSDCDQKMSIEEKNSLKQSSVDSLRPRTNSCGSWSHSNASGEKSSSSASLAASGAGVEMPSDTDSGMADSVSSKMVIIKCKGGTYLSRIFLNNGGIQGVKVVGRVGGVPSPCPQLSSSPHPSSATMSAAPSPVHLPSTKSVGGGSESADSAAGSCGPDSCCVSGSDRPVLHEGEFDHDTADYQWLLDYDEGFSLLPSPSHPSPDSGHDSPPSIHHKSCSSAAGSSSKLRGINDRCKINDPDSVHDCNFSDVGEGDLEDRQSFDGPAKCQIASLSLSHDESEINSYLVSFEDSLMASDPNDDLQKSDGFRNEGMCDLNQYCQTHVNDISFHLIESIPTNAGLSSSNSSNSLHCKSSSCQYNQKGLFHCILSPPSPPASYQSTQSSLQAPSLSCRTPKWALESHQSPPSSSCQFTQQTPTSYRSLSPSPFPSGQSPPQCCKLPPASPTRIKSSPSKCSLLRPLCCPPPSALNLAPPNPSCPAGATNCPRYRESYTRESLGAGGRDGSCRASVLDTNPEPNLQDLSYETLSRHLDANLAEIDMDDFRSDDINQLLALPSVCAQCQRQDRDGEEGGGSVGPSANNTPTKGRRPPVCQHTTWQCQQYEEYDLEEEEFSGVSGDISLYQSGPLFSPLKDPPPIGNTTFSVDSLDCESLHEDLILTCQANKDNYTIAFEGSFIQYSEDSDYHEAGESDTTGSGSWPADRLEGGQSPAPAMTHSDQPYTTWSRVGRKSSTSPSCRTPDPSGTHKSRVVASHLSPAARQQLLHKQHQQQQQQQQAANAAAVADEETCEENSSKSNSMPNLMRRSLLRQSLEAGGQCIKVFDLQNSLRSSHSSARHTDGNSFSLVRLFMKQKSLSKEAISLSSSCTSRSHEGACCSSSENQSAVDSSDWPMNSQSDDMEGSASPVPHSVMRNNQAIIERGMRRRSGGDINLRNVNSNSGDFGHNTSDIISPTGATTLMETDGGCLVNNNNAVNQILDNTGTVGSFDNTANFEESLKEVCPCSKPPMTSPIREEPEGMDISFDSRCENKLVNDQSESETKSSASVASAEKKTASSNSVQNSPAKERSKDSIKGSPNKNVFAVQAEGRNRSQSPATPKRSVHRRDSSQRQRQNSGNSSSGYASTKGSTERLRSTSDSHTPQHTPQRPRPKPRALKQMSDQCLQTSNLKVSATMNTSNLMDRKDIYVYYPNYALPDLSFLKDKKYSVDSRIFLVPQHYRRPAAMTRKLREGGRRPFSCNDMERLRKRGLSHIKDWESLNVLLPKELKEMLSDNSDCMETVKPSYCISPKSPRRPNSCDFGAAKSSNSNTSLSSTQPSSGYRGSSTMLNDSESAQQPLQNAGGEDVPSVPRRSVSLPHEEGGVEGENPPPRPPLPRGILRKVTSLRDDSSQKASVKKRYSAADSPDRLSREDSASRRRSLPESMEGGKDEPIQQQQQQQQALCRTDGDGGDDSVATEMNCSCITTCTGFCGKGLRKKNLLPVSELPNVSSHEEFTEEDLVALRSRVSNFLVGKNLTEENPCDWCPKKSVSFAGQSCQHVHQTVEVASDGPTKSEERPVVYDAQDKKALVMSVRVAVEKLVSHFGHSQAQAAKPKLNPSASNNMVAQITLDKLCPAVYALLSDGLQPSLHSLFGKIANSVWKMIEATSQMGPATKALSDLVLTLNSEECLSEGPMKFNAFIFGLLNIRSLDSWLSYLRTRESILQKHYHPEAFLYLANTATRNLYDDLLLAVRPLSLLPLHLDLLYEYKLLHASLLKMEERLMLHTSSTGNSPGDRPQSVLLDHLLVAKETKEFKNTAAAQQDRVKALMKVLASPEATEADLLQTVAATVTKERSRSPRPRSCYDNAAAAGDDLHPALKKRWSNVQLGSKLITAIDKLMLEEVNVASGSSEDYTDSIDNPKVPKVPSQNSEEEATLAMRDSDISTKEDDISERSATDKDTENEKGPRVCPTSLAFGKGKESEGEKFRRLQMKWELMTGCELPNKCKDADTSDATDEAISFEDASDPTNTTTEAAASSATPAASPSQAAREKVVSPSSGSRSRIPRPVSMTSPQRPFKVFEPSKEKTSPQIKPPLHSRPFGSSPLTGKDLPKPAPRRSLKDKSDDSNNSRPLSIRSRVSPKIGGANVVATGNRASSMPGRSDSVDRGSSSHTSAGGSGRYDSVHSKKSSASVGVRSASHGRRLVPGSVPRYVQTLHHRLATDNGHLSFNRGDSLQVVVEVDDRYLLCCLNGRKGLVPRASVIACGDQ